MTEDRPETFVPFTPGVHVKPAYYRPVRDNPRIVADADVHDIVEAWGIERPLVAAALKYVIRAGRKPGEARSKDLAKACEVLQREIGFEIACAVEAGEWDELDELSDAVRRQPTPVRVEERGS